MSKSSPSASIVVKITFVRPAYRSSTQASVYLEMSKYRRVLRGNVRKNLKAIHATALQYYISFPSVIELAVYLFPILKLLKVTH